MSNTKIRKQCKTCPWKVDADTANIPNYEVGLHQKLDATIAEPGSLRGLRGPQRAMACHYSTEGAEAPCVGWLANQLGPGNNIALRLRALTDPSLANFELDGPQRERFEDTLPPSARQTHTKPKPPRRLRRLRIIG